MVNCLTITYVFIVHRSRTESSDDSVVAVYQQMHAVYRNRTDNGQQQGACQQTGVTECVWCSENTWKRVREMCQVIDFAVVVYYVEFKKAGKLILLLNNDYLANSIY